MRNTRKRLKARQRLRRRLQIEVPNNKRHHDLDLQRSPLTTYNLNQ
jgi:hypothetical protein